MYNMGPKETIPLKMIVEKCRVVPKPEFESLFADGIQTLPPMPPLKTRKAMRSSYQSGRVFFCHRALDTRHGTLKEDLDWDIVEKGDEIPVMNKTLSSSPSVHAHTKLTLQSASSSYKSTKNSKVENSIEEGIETANSSTSDENSVSEADTASSSSEDPESQTEEPETDENKAPASKKRTSKITNDRMKRLRVLAVPVLRPM